MQTFKLTRAQGYLILWPKTKGQNSNHQITGCLLHHLQVTRLHILHPSPTHNWMVLLQRANWAPCLKLLIMGRLWILGSSWIQKGIICLIRVMPCLHKATATMFQDTVVNKTGLIWDNARGWDGQTLLLWLPCQNTPKLQILNCQKFYHGSHGADEGHSKMGCITQQSGTIPSRL